ncbi:MAG TPA: sialidase family protein, partial [Candidatus Dormibacteraeota bacterium]|nr:sialidase family protein [Candidatus Dormibacteraeota bacterium]
MLAPEIQVSPANPYDYSTTAIALDPTDPTILYASANNASSPHVVGFVSGDDGASWGLTLPPRADSGPTAGTFFPSAVFDARGELYQTYMSYAISGGQLHSQIVVARSTNKGETWEHAVVIEPPGSVPERPSITVDHGSGRFHNRLYVAYNTNPSAD